MKGDFSEWALKPLDNLTGVLHQQGRVSLDQDGNAANMISSHLRQMQGRDAIGPHVAAVPAEAMDSFKVTEAHTDGTVVDVTLHAKPSVPSGTIPEPARVWIDGWMLQAPSVLPFERENVKYLAPPIQDPQAKASEIQKDVRDAVILEVWEEALNAFQDPDNLIKPALGGVDTTERVKLFYDIKLLRLVKGDTCGNLVDKLANNFANKGKLTVTPAPTLAIAGDCPVELRGGYTGLEHYLFRIEIAEPAPPGSPDAGIARFKWSRFNGGLVGRGNYASSKVSITANDQMINHCGLNSFYLEAMAEDSEGGRWYVTFSADATLTSDGKLTLTNEQGSWPTTGEAFFRLWDGKALIADFPSGLSTPNELINGLGIRLEFDLPTANNSNYTPGDFWTFPVRTSGTEDFDPTTEWPSSDPPEGIHYHRVPLAILSWNGTNGTIQAPDHIHDCRRIFQPLTKLDSCCTYRVGDGVHSHGDFQTVQAAINALPIEGGEICILPGNYEENVELKAPHDHDIILRGCGRRTVIKAKTNDPAIHVKYGKRITIESLAVEGHEQGIGILLEGEEMKLDGRDDSKYLKDIVLSQLFVRAVMKHAIMGYTAQSLALISSVVHVKEKVRLRNRNPAVYLEGDDMLIERNEIRVLPNRPRNENEALTNDPDEFIAAQTAAGGLQIGGGSERVRIINNLISGGTENGISLGRIDLKKGDKIVSSRTPFKPRDQEEDCCYPDDGYEDEGEENDDGFVAIAGPSLYDILIKFNRISNMGRNGIGVITFFGMGEEINPKDLIALRKISTREIISVSKLVIDENRIERCVNIDPQPIPPRMTALMGYGGISLAHTENLVIRDNFITGNGPSFLEPICGIYVLDAEGVEISRNHILNNGVRTKDVPKVDTVKNGARGGIWISRARSPMVEIGKLLESGRDTRKIPFDSGIPAAKIQENIVSVPLGRSLTLFAQGTVAVVSNQFTNFSIQPVAFDELIRILMTGSKMPRGALLQLLTLLVGNVLVFNYGTPVSAQQTGFREIRESGAEHVRSEVLTSDIDEPQAETGMASYRRLIERFTARGPVLFTNNQCRQNLILSETSIAASSVFIASLDDVGFHDNQCECDFGQDFMLANALVAGFTVRVSDNKFRETLRNVLWSAATFGMMNITTDNESVHCLRIEGGLFLNKHNLVRREMPLGVIGDITEVNREELQKDLHESSEKLCDNTNEVLPNFGGRNRVAAPINIIR